MAWTWNRYCGNAAYVDTNLVGSGMITKAAILGQQGGVWATTAGYNVRSDLDHGLLPLFMFSSSPPYLSPLYRPRPNPTTATSLFCSFVTGILTFYPTLSLVFLALITLTIALHPLNTPHLLLSLVVHEQSGRFVGSPSTDPYSSPQRSRKP